MLPARLDDADDDLTLIILFNYNHLVAHNSQVFLIIWKQIFLIRRWDPKNSWLAG